MLPELPTAGSKDSLKSSKMTISEGGGDVCHQSMMHDLKDTWAKSCGLASDFLLYLAADHGKITSN